MENLKQWSTTLVLVGLLAALAAYIFLVEAKREPPPEPDAPPTPAPLWELESRDIAGITVTDGEQTTAVERDDGDWRMTQPEEGEADIARMSTLVIRVASIKYTRSLGDVDDLGDFGLEEPELRATLVLTDGETIRLSVGSENPGRTARYVQKEGESPVYLVAPSDLDLLFQLLNSPPYPPPPIPTMTPSSES